MAASSAPGITTLAPKSPPIASSAIVNSLVINPAIARAADLFSKCDGSSPSRENKGNLLGNNPLFFKSNLALIFGPV
jgi:hypothetical protein